MWFIGLDLAWGQRSPTGVAAVNDTGHLIHVSARTDDAGILGAVRRFTGEDCVVGIDAPLIVTNPTGNRPAEAALNRDFRVFEAGTHPTNTGRPEFADTPRGARLAAALDLDLDPRSPRARRAFEVYPHAASVALFRLDRTVKYKAKPGRTFGQLHAELLRLMDLIAGLRHAEVALHTSGSEQWQRLYRSVLDATTKSQLRRAEDPVDAVLCAYVVLYATLRPDDVTLYGDIDTGCILTPTLLTSPR